MTRFILLLLLLWFNLSFSQQIEKDSVQHLEEVVITAQYSKQSVKKSVYEVKVINSKAIEQNAANNLADLLNQNLNIHIIPNASTGKSEVSLFGLDGQYFKILKDGIPMVSENGFGNNVDLTQINLDNIKQIEIVEGSMGVVYGANAVSGIINLISKKSSRKDWDISLTAQEETVGNEYEWWQKGRHIQSVKIANNLNDNLFGSLHFSRNNFAGYLNNKKGKNYIENDGLRGYEWLPKDQVTLGSVWHYKRKNTGIFYNYTLFKEFLFSYDASVNTVFNSQTSLFDKTATDTEFKNIRNVHNLNLNTKLFDKMDLNLAFSYQTQEKKYRDYIYDLYTRESDYNEFDLYQSRKTFFSKGTLSNFINTAHFKSQLGYEITREKGFGSSLASVFSSVNVAKDLDNYDVFLSSEIDINDTFSLRPGARYSYQSNFENQLSYSLSSRYLFEKDLAFRANIGSSYRTPNYDELYTYFVDSNHNITGNEALLPENSMSVFTHIKKKTWLQNNSRISNKISVGFVNVKDRIDLAIVQTAPYLAYSYINIDEHKSLNFSTENSFHYKKLKASLGATYIGVSQILNNESNAKDDFLFSLQVNSSLNYFSDLLKTSLSVSYKYNGKQEEFVQRFDEDKNPVFVKGVTDAYNWMDMSLKKEFFNKKISTSVGVRNVFDVSSIKSTAYNGGELQADNSFDKLLGYGRSYFVKLTYKN